MTTLKIKLIVNGEEVETDAVITVDDGGTTWYDLDEVSE